MKKKIGIVGKKRGMSRVFTDSGVSIPVTLLEIHKNIVTQVKTNKTDGYNAIQVTTGKKKPNRVNRPISGHYAKIGVETGEGLWEFKCSEVQDFSVQEVLELDQFASGDYVDISGKTSGKGFQGTVKRWNFRTQDATHGNSLSHRAPGSIGQCQTPGRVFKGKKMSGHMGDRAQTVQSLEVVRVDVENGLLAVKGAVPGKPGSVVIVRPAVKRVAKGNKDGN